MDRKTCIQDHIRSFPDFGGVVKDMRFRRIDEVVTRSTTQIVIGNSSFIFRVTLQRQHAS